MKRYSQNHHIVYKSPEHRQDDLTAKIYNTEHHLIRKLQQFKKPCSDGFIPSLLFEVLRLWVIKDLGNKK